MDLRSGDLREALTALRDLLAERLEQAEPRESAALARQLHDVLVRLDGLGGVEKSELDDLAARRAARLAGVPDSAGKETVKRGG